MVLEQQRAWADRYLLPAAQRADRAGLRPDTVTMVSFGLALAAAALLFLGQAYARGPVAWMLGLGGALVLVSAILDAVDGRLARLQGSAGPRGDYLDHVTDRYADLAILLGLGMAPGADLRILLFAVSGTLLASYMGTQAQAVGVGRDYKGLMSRADRLLLMGLVPIVVGATVELGQPRPELFGWLLLGIGAMTHLTAIQRFLAGWRELTRRRDGS